MEELHEYEQVKPLTIKQLYLQASGVPVKLDYFLFTCFEEEATYQALPAGHRRQFDLGRWPVALVAQSEGKLAASYHDRELGTIIDDLCAWYGVNYPLLMGSQALDYEVQSEFLAPFIRLVIDIKAIVALKTGSPLPLFDGDLQPAAQQAPWPELQAKLKEHFPTYGEWMHAYLSWACRKTKPMDYDLGSLPPVGRFAGILHKFKRKLEDNNRRAAYHNPSRQREEPRSSDSSRPPARGGRPHADAAPRSSVPRGAMVLPKKEGFSSSEGSPRERDALAEVDQALAKLQQSAELSELVLQPQNSFIRRKQHKVIVDRGFLSESTGEGASRAVKILRSSPLES